MRRLNDTGRQFAYGALWQQSRVCWMGGQGTDPYEQNTQQSPDLGFNSAPQPWQS